MEFPNDKQNLLVKGTEFSAKSRLDTHRYRMVGVDLSRDGFICLLNLNDDTLTHVEPEWFRQRRIAPVQEV